MTQVKPLSSGLFKSLPRDLAYKLDELIRRKNEGYEDLEALLVSQAYAPSEEDLKKPLSEQEVKLIAEIYNTSRSYDADIRAAILLLLSGLYEPAKRDYGKELLELELLIAMNIYGEHIPQGLGPSDNPTFKTVKLTDLTDTYIPYHVDDNTGLADSPISTDGTDITLAGTANLGDINCGGENYILSMRHFCNG